MDWQLFLCVLLTWSLVSASLANRPLHEARSSDEFTHCLSRRRQNRQTANRAFAGNEQILEYSGQITTPNFPENYPNKALCQWRIEAPANKTVSLVFLAFNLQHTDKCDKDSLKIYDGTSNSAVQLGNYCGDMLPRTTHSSGRNMFLSFRSKDSTTNFGFWILYSFKPGTTTACGPGRPRIVTLSEGANEIIQSPGNLERYPHNAHCQWKIIAPEGKRVQVHFNRFLFQKSPTCGNDKVKLFDGSTTKNNTFGQFCGYRTPPDAFSPGNIIMVLFNSDSTTTERAFRITLSGVDAGESEPTCGSRDTSRISGKIFPGKETVPHIWPWQILLQNDSDFICSGSIISKDWIITAAHCVNKVGAKRLTVIVGEHDRTVTEGTEQIYAVASIIIHDRYNIDSRDNDIALLRLASSIHYTMAIKPICLPLVDVFPGHMCDVTGWGNTEWHTPSNKLKEVTLPLIRHRWCHQSDWHGTRITATMLCAGYVKGGRDVCTGDGGGPLTCFSYGKFVLEGILSWSMQECGLPKKPAVFTRVSRFTGWVSQKTNGAFQPGR